jgi:hypothetical protein
VNVFSVKHSSILIKVRTEQKVLCMLANVIKRLVVYVKYSCNKLEGFSLHAIYSLVLYLPYNVPLCHAEEVAAREGCYAVSWNHSPSNSNSSYHSSSKSSSSNPSSLIPSSSNPHLSNHHSINPSS